MAINIGGILDEINVNSSITAQIKSNQLLEINFIRSLALIYAMKVAVRINYDSANSALATMENIIEKVNNHLIKLGDDAADSDLLAYDKKVTENFEEMYRGIESLRAPFVQVMRDIGASKARILDYQVPANSISTIELPYNKYNDVTRDEEIFNRNKPKVRHPGFLPAGDTVEILTS